MGRQLISTLQLTQSALKLSTPSQQTVAKKDAVAKQQQAANNDKRHRACNIPTRQQGEDVWVSDIQSRATIIEMYPNRSYTLRTVIGRVIRRNTRALRPLLPEHHHQQHQNNSIFDNSTLRIRIRIRAGTHASTNTITSCLCSWAHGHTNWTCHSSSPETGLAGL